MITPLLRHAACTGLVWLLTAVTALALFRGDEFQPRDWKLSEEYFMDQFSFQPDYEYRLKLRNQDRAYLGAGGSVTSKDLYAYQEFIARSDTIQLDQRDQGNRPLQITARFLMDQDFDGTYKQFFLGADVALAKNWDFQLIGEPLPLKEFADLGIGLKREDEDSIYTLQLHLPNFVFDSKNQDGAQFRQQPFNLQWTIQTGMRKGLEFWFAGDIDFPSKIEYPEEEFLFDFEKYRTRLGLDYHWSEHQLFRLEAEHEFADKERQGRDPLDPASFDTNRNYWAALLEYILRRDGNSLYTCGYKFVRFDESNLFRNDPEESFDIDRYDHIIYGTFRRPVFREFFMGTGLYLDWQELNQDVVLADRPNPVLIESGLHAKWSLELGLHSDTYHLAMGPSLDLDEFKFGGGYLNVYFDF